MQQTCAPMIVDFDDRGNSIRDLIEMCMNQHVIISAHNRSFGWKEDYVTSYINNAFKKTPHIGHILSIFKNYRGEELRGVYFDISSDGITSLKDLENKEDIDNIPDFHGKYIMKDGRHKTQAFIWLVTGKKVSFSNNENKAKRFYVRFKITENEEKNEIDLTLENTNRLHFIEEDDEIFTKEENQNKYMYFLFRLCDDMWYKGIDILPTIEAFAQEPYLAYKIDKQLSRYKDSFSILYNNLSSISRYISFQIDDVSDVEDEYTLAEIIRAIQLGAPWNDLDIFETWAEYNVGDDEFRKNSIKLYREFQERKLLRGKGSDANHIMYVYTMRTAKRIKKADLGLTIQHHRKYPDMVNRLQSLVNDFVPSSDFLLDFFQCIEAWNPHAMIRNYLAYFHFLSPWFFNKRQDLVKSNTGSLVDWSTNSETKYIVKLLYKALFKFNGPGKEKSHMTKNLYKTIIPGIYNILKDKEIFGEDEYFIVDRFICDKVSSESFGPINATDLTDNFKLLWNILYRYPINPNFKIDADHDLSKNESNTWSWNDERSRQTYDDYYRDSYLNLIPLSSTENRADKIAKSQLEWYIDGLREADARNKLIDVNMIIQNADPYVRMVSNKRIKDQAVKDFFSQYHFDPQEDFDLTMP